MSTLKTLVSTSLAVHDIERNDARQSEIAIEAERLISGVASVTDRLDFQSEPSHYAALMMKGASHD